MKTSIKIRFTITLDSNPSGILLAYEVTRKTIYSLRFYLKCGSFGMWEIWHYDFNECIATFPSAAQAPGKLIEWLKGKYDKVTVEV